MGGTTERKKVQLRHQPQAGKGNQNQPKPVKTSRKKTLAQRRVHPLLLSTGLFTSWDTLLKKVYTYSFLPNALNEGKEISNGQFSRTTRIMS